MDHHLIRKVEQQFRETVRLNGLWGPEDHLLVGISGGPDSVALAYLVVQTGLPATLAHVQYGLRGMESVKDEELVRTLARDWEIPLLVFRPDPTLLKSAPKATLQEEARRIRYQWWDILVQAGPYTRVLTGHQADDQLETMLVYMLRGHPGAWTRHISYRNGNIARPLLDIPRESIVRYLQACRLPWREDQSNQDGPYLRNRIRQEVVPVLKKIQPQLSELVPAQAAWVAQMTAAAHEALVQWEGQAMQLSEDELLIDLRMLREVPWAGFALYSRLYPLGFHPRQIQQILALESRKTGQVFISPAWVLAHDRGRLIGKRRTDVLPPEPVTVSAFPATIRCGGIILDFQPFTNRREVPELSSSTLLMDADVLAMPLTVRPWEPGDRFVPLGMKGHKKVKDLLIHRKKNVFEKQSTLVLTGSEGTLYAVLGEQMSDTAKVREGSKSLVLITLTHLS